MSENEKSKKRMSAAYLLLRKLDGYVTELQKGSYARRMRVALFWSAASLFYLAADLEIESLVFVSVKNEITHEVFCFFLLSITTYYAIMFAFVFSKVWSVYRPAQIFRVLFQYRKKRIAPDVIQRIEGQINHAEEDLALFEGLSNMRPGFLREEIIPIVPEMKSEKEVLEFMVTRARMGWLENLVARMYFPTFLCVLALWALFREVSHLIFMCFANPVACLAKLFN
ncbi:MAG: hypothetical protein MPL62_12865 [Alphaproteobacteria bacterium]|nr:hypothetical protein [Alphaproteobacteria bacterium]